MPELPDLEYIQARLSRELAGSTIQNVLIKQPLVLRNLLNLPDANQAVADGPALAVDEALIGLSFDSLHRHGPFLHFAFIGDGPQSAVDLIVHPMLAGRFHLQERDESKQSAAAKTAKKKKTIAKKKSAARGGKPPGPGLCFQLEFADRTLSYLDTKKMGKLYVTRPGRTAAIPRYDQQGLGVLSEEFTKEAFLQLLEKRKRQQVRVLLMDQNNLSAIGNAYADEILFAAGIHPKTIGAQLDPEEKSALFNAIRSVLAEGIKAVRTADQSIDVKVRDHMRVRNRRDQACYKCGATVRRVAVLGHDAFFCPDCQPPKRDLFIDWRKS